MRLHEARCLMVVQACALMSAAYKMGYKTPSQFGWDYNRLFGAPSIRDIVQLRAQEQQQQPLSIPHVSKETRRVDFRGSRSMLARL